MVEIKKMGRTFSGIKSVPGCRVQKWWRKTLTWPSP